MQETKVCFKCHKEQSIECFYRHPRMADGHLGKCKECAKRDAREARSRKIDHYRAYDRHRGNRQTPEYRQQYARSNNGKECRQRSRAASAEKYKARTALGNAVRDGRVCKPLSCEGCGATGVRINGHHPDYSKPLEVIWCCTACHGKQHRKYKD